MYIGMDLTRINEEVNRVIDKTKFLFTVHKQDLPYNETVGLDEISTTNDNNDYVIFLRQNIENMLNVNKLGSVVKVVGLVRNKDSITVNLSVNGTLVTKELT